MVLMPRNPWQWQPGRIVLISQIVIQLFSAHINEDQENMNMKAGFCVTPASGSPPEITSRSGTGWPYILAHKARLPG